MRLIPLSPPASGRRAALRCPLAPAKCMHKHSVICMADTYHSCMLHVRINNVEKLNVRLVKPELKISPHFNFAC